MKFQIFISLIFIWVAVVVLVEGARKKKKQKPTDSLSEENMAELTQKYFTCNMKIHKSLTGDDMAGFKGKPPKCPSSDGGKCIIGCIMTEMGVMSNNQINLTTAEALIRRKAGDQAEIGIDLLKVCAEKVGVQKDECSAGAKTCECVMESGLITQMG